MGPRPSSVAPHHSLHRLQCLSAGSPLGTSTNPYATPALPRNVFNAFRLGVHLGPRYNSCLQQRHGVVFNAFRLGVHLGRNESVAPPGDRTVSSMPFGWESTWDEFYLSWKISGGGEVFNAFRLGVHLGRVRQDINADNGATSSMPFGWESTWDLLTKSAVNGTPSTVSSMPFGWESTWDTTCNPQHHNHMKKSSMPFGWESTWDVVSLTESREPGRLGLQCLSAGSPLGTLRLRGHGGETRIQGLQCLSAGSPLGTPLFSANIDAFASASSMPFGWEPTWDMTVHNTYNKYE